MSYTTDLKTWDDPGSEYADTYSYQDGEQPVAEWDNYVMANAIEDIQHLVDSTNTLTSDLDSHTSADNPHSASASESWVSSNFNDYSDSDARSALEGSSPTFNDTTIDNTLYFNGGTDAEELQIDARTDPNAIHKYDASGGSDPWREQWYDGSNYHLLETVSGGIELDGSLIARRTWVNSNFNDYSDSDARNALEGSSPTFDSISTEELSGNVVGRSEAIDNLEGNLYLEPEDSDPSTVLENDGDMVFIHE